MLQEATECSIVKANIKNLLNFTNITRVKVTKETEFD